MSAEILHGDCLAVMRDLPAASFDTVLTDPPFSSGTRREASGGHRHRYLQAGMADRATQAWRWGWPEIPCQLSYRR